MADPQTSNIGLYVPTRGSDPGTWDLPENANDSATDTLFANVAVISLTNAPVTLTTPPNSGAAWSGPYQSQSGILRFTGTLSADVTVTLPRAGFFIVQNKCVVGAFAVILASAAPGNVIGAPPGEAIHVINDGVNVDFVALGRVNEYEDWAVSAMPRWVTVCTVPPYLNCDGTSFSGVTYPTTAAYLGGTTLPDQRGRVRAALNQTTGRITTAGSGVDGNTILSSGGNQNATILQVNFPNVNFTGGTGTVDVFQNGASANAGGGGGFNFINSGAGATPKQVTGVSVPSGGSGTPLTTLDPMLIAGLTVIRAG